MTMTKTPRRARRDFLGIPATSPRPRLPRPDADTFGALSERVARFFGTARFLGFQR